MIGSRQLRRLGFCLALVLGAAAPLAALDPARLLTQYSHRMWQQELPQNSVHSVLQSADGYLWVGTYEGLARFDGIRFVVFDVRRTGDLAGTTVTHLFEDSRRRLWISTDHGLTVLEGGRFRSYTAADGLLGGFVNATAEAADGSLLIATSSGLFRRRDETITAVELPSECAGRAVRTLAVAGDTTWLVSDAGVVALGRGGARRFGAADGLPEVPPRVLLATTDGTVLVGGDGGLFRGSAGGFAELELGLGRVPAVRALFVDRRGVLWVGTEQHGLVRWHLGRSAVLGAANGLSHDYVRSITEDHEGSLWVGTNSGLNQLREAKVISYATREGLAAEFARTVFEDRDGAIWIGTDGGGLDRFADGRFTNFRRADGLANDSVRAIGQTPDGALWIGTRGGVSRFADGRFTTYGRGAGLSSLLVRAVFVDRHGVPWVGTEDGLNRWNGDGFSVITTADGLAGNDVRALFEDAAGRLWIGTFNGASCLAGGVFTTYDVADGLSSDIVFAFFEERPGELWVGTDNGLNLLRDGRITSFDSSRHGLFDDKFFAILADDVGGVWSSSNHGIARITRAELRGLADGTVARVAPLAIDASDGMRTSQCNGASQPAGWKTRNGHLWFPTPHGVVELEPGNIPVNIHPPPVSLEDVVVDGRLVEAADPVVIPAGAESIELHFTALSLAAPEWVRFRYRLVGYDRGWVEAGARRAAYYTNLSPGSYSLQVVAGNDDGVWNETGATLALVILPSWWQTWWARLVLATLGVAAVWTVVRLRLAAMEQRTAQLEAMVAARTAELADKVRELEASERNAHISERRAVEASRTKSIFLSNMSHELRTPLNSIIGFSSILKTRLADADDERLLRFVTNIHGSGEHLLGIINDILDLAKIEAGRMELYLESFEIAPLLEDVRRVMQGMAHRRGITVTIAPSAAPVELTADRAKLKQVLVNLLSNAVKFSPGGAEVTVRSELLAAADSPLEVATVAVAVEDHGPGIARRHHEIIFEEFRQVDGSASREHEGTGLGLALVRRLLTLQGGKIGLESELGQGSTFTIWMPQQVAAREVEEE